MKKNLILWGTALILVIAAIYVTTHHNATGNNPQVQSTASQSSVTSAQSSAPAETVQTSTQAADQSSQASQDQPSQASQDQPSQASQDQPQGEKAIDFSLTDLNGSKVSLKDLKGKSVYINFWTTWCPWCVKELPDIEKVYQQYKDKGLVVLAIDIGEDKDTVKSFVDKNKLSFDILLDTDQSTAEAYAISSIPVSIFVDKDGNVTAKRVGALSEADMLSYVKQLVGK